MKSYYDTGVLLKLYTAEPESEAVQAFVTHRAQPVRITDFHVAECIAAFRLKHFRKECEEEQASGALNLLKQDIRGGTLRLIALDWGRAWLECGALADKYASATGVRTLDTLHVASAILFEAKEFITTDRRQAALASRVGLKVINPTA